MNYSQVDPFTPSQDAVHAEVQAAIRRHLFRLGGVRYVVKLERMAARNRQIETRRAAKLARKVGRKSRRGRRR